jgi:hypothetical protein
MDDRFVITGSGRCGTTWISRALTRTGLPCGHETVFNPWTPEWPDHIRADSSWVAACQLDRVDALDLPVVLLVRHPLAVVKSLVEIGFFAWDTDNEYHQPLCAAFPEVYDWATPENRALDMWVKLNSAALTRAEVILRFESITRNQGEFSRLLRWADVDPGWTGYALEEPPCNRHEESRERTGVNWKPCWDAHDPGLARHARELAKILGYRGGEG